MNIEFEATFTRVNKDEIREILQKIGAKRLRPESLMRRTVFHPPIEITGGWMRVRDEGDKITMSLKVVDGKAIENQKEIQLVVDDFGSAVDFLLAIGARQKAYQETLRELWEYLGAEITIDTWPGLNPFVEIEANQEAVVRKVAEAMGFDYRLAKFCEVSTIYQEELGIPPEMMKNHLPVITFENPPQRYVG